MTIYFVVLLTTGAKLRVFADIDTAQRFCDAWNKQHHGGKREVEVIREDR